MFIIIRTSPEDAPHRTPDTAPWIHGVSEPRRGNAPPLVAHERNASMQHVFWWAQTSGPQKNPAEVEPPNSAAETDPELQGAEALVVQN